MNIIGTIPPSKVFGFGKTSNELSLHKIKAKL